MPAFMRVRARQWRATAVFLKQVAAAFNPDWLVYTALPVTSVQPEFRDK